MYVELAIYSDLYGPDILITRVWNIFTCLLKHLFLTAVWILYILHQLIQKYVFQLLFSLNKIYLYDNWSIFSQFMLNFILCTIVFMLIVIIDTHIEK